MLPFTTHSFVCHRKAEPVAGSEGRLCAAPSCSLTHVDCAAQAIATAMNALGEYVGLVLQNQTLQQKILNYHVIPGQKIKAQDLGTKIKTINTREGEPLNFIQHG